uniref:Hemopexin n=1 Tax=Petromyzon marinus TaxID=7757 RepID=A0AAJ7XFE9_PETMA|nr:hemopexin [Petromyzon marinus]
MATSFHLLLMSACVVLGAHGFASRRLMTEVGSGFTVRMYVDGDRSERVHGEGVKVMCSVTGPTSTVLVWHHPDSVAGRVTTGARKEQEVEEEGVIKSKVEEILQVEKLSLGDGGAYGCHVLDHNDLKGNVDIVVREHIDIPDRCEEGNLDAVASSLDGITYIFKGPVYWKNFGPNASMGFIDTDWKIPNGSISAAFRRHSKSDEHHHKTYIFKGGEVWRYVGMTLEPGFPMAISAAFPGAPASPDAVVECPAEDCRSDSVLFFKGGEVLACDLFAGACKQRSFPALPTCSAATRWLGRYYCFHGHEFYRFEPTTGLVPPGYPRDARVYFHHCPDHVHKKGSSRDPCHDTNGCSGRALDALSVGPDGRSFAFRGAWFWRLDTRRDGMHPFRIIDSWPGTPPNPDSAFEWNSNMVFTKGELVWIFKGEGSFVLLSGFPKPISTEFPGLPAPWDAAFICSAHPNTLTVTKGGDVWMYELTSRAVTCRGTVPGLLGGNSVSAASCSHDSVSLALGDELISLTHSGTRPAEPHCGLALAPGAGTGSVAKELFHCPADAARCPTPVGTA